VVLDDDGADALTGGAVMTSIGGVGVRIHDRSGESERGVWRVDGRDANEDQNCTGG
jgi:hypothetical protein